ncbi:MAG: hypothetical protein L3J86_02245 [Thermoplasmata archaeon]|nr:hypothetical protein [Thermoplasmata archaeon]
MSHSMFRRPDPPPAVVVDRIRPVEVPTLTEVKRRLGRNDVAGALLYAYPKIVEDLGRAYGVDFPEGFSHEEILAKRFNAEMAPMAEFFDRLYRLYAPVRFGRHPTPHAADIVLELVQSLYSPEPMLRLYVTNLGPSAPTNGGGNVPTSNYVTSPPEE